MLKRNSSRFAVSECNVASASLSASAWRRPCTWRKANEGFIVNAPTPRMLDILRTEVKASVDGHSRGVVGAHGPTAGERDVPTLVLVSPRPRLALAVVVGETLCLPVRENTGEAPAQPALEYVERHALRPHRSQSKDPGGHRVPTACPRIERDPRASLIDRKRQGPRLLDAAGANRAPVRKRQRPLQ
eukprot:4524540-Prymnesium_polylepis.1